MFVEQLDIINVQKEEEDIDDVIKGVTVVNDVGHVDKGVVHDNKCQALYIIYCTIKHITQTRYSARFGNNQILSIDEIYNKHPHNIIKKGLHNDSVKKVFKKVFYLI